VVVHLRGLVPSVPVQGAVNALWIISHPDDVTIDECERFDLVFVASEPFAEQLAPAVEPTVIPLLQAAAAERFAHDVLSARPHNLVFVGNTRGVERCGVQWALEAGLPLEIWGQGWSGEAQDRVVADLLDNRELPALYSASKLVLCEHWPDMKDAGFVSNRVFEAAAAGALPIADHVQGIGEVLAADLPTYDNEESLRDLYSIYVHAEDGRLELASRLQRYVLGHHTFDNRASVFTEVLRPMLNPARRSFVEWSPDSPDPFSLPQGFPRA
jgi:hypothetical protein